MAAQNTPLAARMRPATLDELVGQPELTAPGSPIRAIVEDRVTASVLLWAGPGSGKTTVAQIIGAALAADDNAVFTELSAINAGVKDVRTVIAAAQKHHAAGGRTVLFLDEIHRFTKSQQDSLLHAMETGWITLIGATTENPSFSVNSAIASRSVLVRLNRLTEADIATVLTRAVEDPRGFDGGLQVQDEAIEAIARLADGDARQGLNRLELAAQAVQPGQAVTVELVNQLAGRANPAYDHDGDQHYDVTSAFIKSMRGSDPDAALHWLARMLHGGEDPRFVARRIMIHASEDVGMADPMALLVATAAAQAVQLVGMPEAQIILSQAVLHIATAPKSPQANAAIKAAMADVADGVTGPVPEHLRDSHYPGAKALGHGAGYLFPHDHPYGIVAQQYLPDQLHAQGRRYYHPTDNGREKAVSQTLAAIRQMTGPEQTH